jgi:hypothetical protein
MTLFFMQVRFRSPKGKFLTLKIYILQEDCEKEYIYATGPFHKIFWRGALHDNAYNSGSVAETKRDSLLPVMWGFV